MKKTGDEVVDSMFDEIAEVTVSPDGMVEASLVPDSAQEMENAVADMARSWREFRDINAEGPIAIHDYAWWKALVYLSLAEDCLKTAFCGRDRSPRSIKAYYKFRLKMVTGKRYRTDA
jgi:hypothetical protein